METTFLNRRSLLSTAFFLLLSSLTIPQHAAAQLSGTYYSAPGTTVTYQYQNDGFPTVKLPADITVTFSGDNPTSSLTATIHQPIIGDTAGNFNYPIVDFFPLVVTGSSNDGRDFEGELLPETQGYYFDWQFEPANDGKLKWTGWVAWLGGRIEVSTIDGGASLVPTVPGDYNRNGSVDAADYVMWRDELADGGLGYADGNQDGTVDTADYDIWKANFGLTPASAAALAGGTVPEPATLALLLAGLFALACRRGQTKIF
jgi:hypothetical protein